MVEAIVAAISALVGVYLGFVLQNYSEEKKNRTSQKASAAVLYADIMSNLKDMIQLSEYYNEKTKDIRYNLSFGSHSSKYSEHISNLEGKICLDQQICIHQFYGFITAFQRVRFNDLSEQNSDIIKNHISPILAQYCTTVFGDEVEFSKLVQENRFDTDKYINKMKSQYISAVSALVDIKKQ